MWASTASASAPISTARPFPAEIGDVAGLPRLVDAMRRHGYDEATLRKLCYENWMNVLERTWGR